MKHKLKLWNNSTGVVRVDKFEYLFWYPIFNFFLPFTNGKPYTLTKNQNETKQKNKTKTTQNTHTQSILTTAFLYGELKHQKGL